MATLPDYAELHVVSNFTFLRGASHPEELVEEAAARGYRALALTDECSLAGVVRAHKAAQQHSLALIIGSELRLRDGPRIVVLASNAHGYGQLSSLITQARRSSPKGQYRLDVADFPADLSGCLALLLPDDELDIQHAHWLQHRFPQRAWLAVELLGGRNDRARLRQLLDFSAALHLPAVACGDVHMHERTRRPLQDTLTAIRLGLPVHTCQSALFPNGERHLRPRERLQRIYPPELLDETLRIAERCQFSLRELRYEYPHELVPPAYSASAYVRELTYQGAQRRWPNGMPAQVTQQVEHELALIAELNYEHYFLTVHGIVSFARRRGILCQGRGSAANSAVCFCLGITEVDPARMNMLFERFISRERNEPPDIDVDFEHERREEVIQYIYEKYGRERAALAATVITYQPRSVIRDVGKALGLELAQVDRLAKQLSWWDGGHIEAERLRDAGFDPDVPLLKKTLALANELIGFPRHLSQHVGGFVISHTPLSQWVPIENAAMPGRTVIQWDKDDLDTLGLLKVDCLALGMLTAIHRCFDLIARHRGRELTLATIPAEDPATYAMVQRADTVGVFQIESRAQMAMLPRLKPRCFYDLVVEVALVRPGPIQGDMVHPYLRRRSGQEPVSYPSEALKAVLERTLGVPIFQEQVMQVAMVAAGFGAGEADQLRRAMAAWRRKGGLDHFEQRLLSGMTERGYGREFAQQIFQQILGFGEYGFPESHAASFALLVYVSAWLKCHEPAAFTCALLNSQPMGFYGPSQLVQDARRHGVDVRAVDVQRSAWNSTLESGPENDDVALRLGLHRVKGLRQQAAERIVAARAHAPFYAVNDLAQRAALNQKDLAALADAGALTSLAGNRHQARWAALGVEEPLPLFAAAVNESGLFVGAPSLARSSATATDQEIAARRPLLRDNASSLFVGAPPFDSPLFVGAPSLARSSATATGQEIAARRPLLRDNASSLFVGAPPFDSPLSVGAPSLARSSRGDEPPPHLPVPTEGQNIVDDYTHTGLTLGRHPLALLRPRLAAMRVCAADSLRNVAHGTRVRVAGLVTCRQRPGAASGVTFLTLEDETGFINGVVWADLADKQRRELLQSRLLLIEGRMEREGEVIHVIARRLHDHSGWLGRLATVSRDFC